VTVILKLNTGVIIWAVALVKAFRIKLTLISWDYINIQIAFKMSTSNRIFRHTPLFFIGCIMNILLSLAKSHSFGLRGIESR